MKHLFTALVAFAILLSSCTSENDFQKGKQQLEQQGYTDIVNTGIDLFCCDEKDGFTTGFSAKDKSGNRVDGCFCSGVTKGLTIRFQ